MAARNISFQEFSPDIQKVLNQALKTALAQAEELPTVFGLYGDNDMPTHAEVEHATEILRTTLTEQTIYYGAEMYISDALRFVAWDIENWIGSKDDSQSIKSAMAEYASRFGMDVSPSTLVELKCLARSLCPHAEIGITSRVGITFDDANLLKCLDAFKRTDTIPTVDYGQNNMGIVVDGVMFDFPSNHPAVSGIRSLLLDYQNKGRWERAQ